MISVLDLDLLVYTLLTRSIPDVPFAPDLDVDSIGRLPLVTFTVTGGAAVAGSPAPPFAWDASLALSVFGEGIDEARATAGRVYDAVWSWDDPFNGLGIIDGLGHAAAIDDESLFTRIGTVDIAARSITQYAGSFGLQLHKA